MAPKRRDTANIQLNKRNSARANIERIGEFISQNGDNLSKAELECRLGIVESYFQQMITSQEAIEEGEFENEFVNGVEMRTSLESLYCQVKSSIMTLIEENTCNSNTTKYKPTAARPESLPKLKLPQFAGKYSEYPNFKKLFTTLIDSEQRLTTIEKFNHLLSSLSGQALNMIKMFDITEENYYKALQLLEERYNNKHLIAEEHIKALFKLQKIQRNSAEQLRGLIDTITGNLTALSSIYNYEEITNSMVVHLVMSCLDSESLASQESISYTEHVGWTNCVKVLTRRCQVLEVRAVNQQNTEHQQSR